MSSVRVMRHVRVMSLVNEAFLGDTSRAKVVSRVRVMRHDDNHCFCHFEQ